MKRIASRLGIILILATLNPAPSVAEDKMVVDMSKLTCGELILDTNARVASARGAPLPLTPKEYALLETLLRHRGRSFTRAALFERLYDGLSDASDRVIEVVVSTLRTKLDKAGLPALIETRRGFGYRVP